VETLKGNSHIGTSSPTYQPVCVVMAVFQLSLNYQFSLKFFPPDVLE